MPVHKSDAGWRRMNARVAAKAPVRTARMDHRVRSSAAKPKADQPLVAQLEPEVTEYEAVSFCIECDGPCTCST